MRKILALLFAIAGISAFAQDPGSMDRRSETILDSDRGYYIKDSVAYYVHIYREGVGERSKRLLIPKQHGHLETAFTPEDISEFGFTTGERYFSVRVDTGTGYEWCFLEELQRMSDGSSILYLWQESPHSETYYRFKDGVAGVITTKTEPQPMWDLFYSMNDCLKWRDQVKYPSVLKRGMIKRYYNALANCNEKVFSRTRFGVTASTGAGKVKINDRRPSFEREYINSRLFEASYQYDMSFSVGIFFRIPIEEVVSFQGELLYLHHSVTESNVVKYKVNILRLPLLFRFNNNFARKNLMPYAELGPCFDINFGRYHILDRWENKSAPSFAFGAALGVGAEYYISPKRAAYLGARFSMVANRQRDYKYNFKIFELVAGFSLF